MSRPCGASATNNEVQIVVGARCGEMTQASKFTRVSILSPPQRSSKFEETSSSPFRVT